MSNITFKTQLLLDQQEIEKDLKEVRTALKQRRQYMSHEQIGSLYLYRLTLLDRFRRNRDTIARL